MEKPIFYAAELGYYKILITLARDPRVNLYDQDIFGDTALHYAAKEGCIEIVK